MNASQLKKYFDPAIERTNIAQPQDPQVQNEQPVDAQENVNSQENNENSQNVPSNNDARETQNQTDDTVVESQQYPYDIRKLVKYRHRDQYFYIEWTDGSKTWEPQENVRPDLVEQYFKKYTKKGRLRRK